MAVGYTPIVAIIGRANVGKSTLFNRLVGSRMAITYDTAGTTRDPIYGLVKWGEFNFWMVDTAGLKSAENELEENIQEQIVQASQAAAAIVLVTDATVPPTTEDIEAARLALKSKKPVILAINKSDTAGAQPSEEFLKLGVKTVVRVSAIQGSGTGDLLDEVGKVIVKAKPPKPETRIKVGILGRPNVGKSSLLNNILGKQQAIVSSSAGTTRDVNRGDIKYHGQTIEIMDTAGLRRRGKIAPGIEKFSTLRTLAAVAESDICVLVMDATEASVAGDQHIAGLVTEAGKGLILVVNKWDLIERDDKTQSRFAGAVQHDFQFAWWSPLVFTSAETGLNVTKLFDIILGIHERRQTKIPTARLNTLLQKLTAAHPPAGLKGRQPKINYVTQTGSQPPAFTFFCSYPELLHFSYKRYLENGLRAEFDFSGTPISLVFKSKREERKKK